MAAASVNFLAVVLKEPGWSYTRLIAELRRHARVALPKTENMVTLVSRWVNNHQQPDDFYVTCSVGRPAGLAPSCPATNRQSLPRCPRGWPSPSQWAGSPQAEMFHSPWSVTD
jgi:hypothetical protein